MGMDANVVCMGPFDEAIADCLDYDPNDYGSVPKNYPVVTTVMNCNTTDASRELARLLRANPEYFETHCINGHEIDWAGLEEMAERMVEWDDYEVHTLHRLLDAGFTCIYCPNM